MSTLKNQQGIYINDNQRYLEEKWHKIKKSYQNLYPSLTNNDLNLESGELSKLTTRIAEKTKRTNEQVISEIYSWKAKKVQE